MYDQELEEKAHAINEVIGGVEPTQQVLEALDAVWDNGVTWGYFYA